MSSDLWAQYNPLVFLQRIQAVEAWATAVQQNLAQQGFATDFSDAAPRIKAYVDQLEQAAQADLSTYKQQAESDLNNYKQQAEANISAAQANATQALQTATTSWLAAVSKVTGLAESDYNTAVQDLTTFLGGLATQAQAALNSANAALAKLNAGFGKVRDAGAAVYADLKNGVASMVAEFSQFANDLNGWAQNPILAGYIWSAVNDIRWTFSNPSDREDGKPGHPVKKEEPWISNPPFINYFTSVSNDFSTLESAISDLLTGG